MGVSKNRGTPKSSILIGFSIIFTIHFGDTTIFGNTRMVVSESNQYPPGNDHISPTVPGTSESMIFPTSPFLLGYFSSFPGGQTLKN